MNAEAGVDEIARGIEPIDRAGGDDLAHCQTAGDVGDGLRRDRRTETAAQGSEPLQLLAVLEIDEHGRITHDTEQRRVADRSRTDRSQIGVLIRVLQIRFDAGEPIAGSPIVADLGAEDAAVELGRASVRKQRGAADRVAICDIGLGAPEAVADVEAEIETSPSPR